MEHRPLTKAETLASLSGEIANGVVPPLLFFSVSDWETRREEILDSVSSSLGQGELAIRSSAQDEDGKNATLAGQYRSFLNVSNEKSRIKSTVDSVTRFFSDNPDHQILIQEMVSDAELSGVILTHELNTGAPYYVIEYQESSRTDLVTGGLGTPRHMAIYRKAADKYVKSKFVRRILILTRELELRLSSPLDIEFAQGADGTVFLLQVRTIPVGRNWNRHIERNTSQALRNLERFVVERNCRKQNLAGSATILGQMPDWNPAELIGVRPNPLAVSLFSTLITGEVWQEARSLMGYRPVPNEPLMVVLAGRPYIDVRNSFNSFLPQGLPRPLAETIVDAWLERLREHPEFHDKVEFDVAQTVLDFDFDSTYQTRYGGVLTTSDFDFYREQLRRLSRANISLRRSASLPRALQAIRVLGRIEPIQAHRSQFNPLRRAIQLLGECRNHGTLPFSIIARHAFMAETLLRSAVHRGALLEERLLEFHRKVSTVAVQLTRDFAKVQQGVLERESFLLRYGHLRPGSFDVVSLRYDQRPDLFAFDHSNNTGDETREQEFVPNTQEERDFGQLLKEVGLDISVAEFLHYANLAIRGREHAKFVFSKHLSEALECIADWGDKLGLTRNDVSFLTLDDLSGALISPVAGDEESHFYELAESRRSLLRAASNIRLGHLIREPADLYVITADSDQPNFVTSRTVEGIPVQLQGRGSIRADLSERIVCLEFADPGYDWIFTRNIIGLITKYGGANSHMAIRCAEMDVPAAIGVGETLFEQFVRSKSVEIRCLEKVVRPVYG